MNCALVNPKKSTQIAHGSKSHTPLSSSGRLKPTHQPEQSCSSDGCRTEMLIYTTHELTARTSHQGMTSHHPQEPPLEAHQKSIPVTVTLPHIAVLHWSLLTLRVYFL